MESNVITALSEFLEALPYQVMMWDKKVVHGLAGNPRYFVEFQTGDADVKWDIYKSLRYKN